MVQIPSSTSQYDILNSATTYTLGPNNTINVTNENGIFVSDVVEESTVVVRGDIDQSGAGFAGIWTEGTDMTIRILAGGSVSGDTGIHSENFEPSSTLDIFNDGLIEGDAFAIETFDTRDTVVNTGTIQGRINLGSGRDLFDNRGGTVDRRIEGGTGNDTLITDKAGVKLREDGGSAGYDTVRTTVTYTLSENVERLILLGGRDINGTGTLDGDDLFGNSGRNRLNGLDGVDSLDGKRDNDVLTGGDNADTFIFKTGYDRDTIRDFENGVDEIDLKAWNAIASFADLRNNHLFVSGDDLIIRAGSDELVLLDTKKNELDNGDFDI